MPSSSANSRRCANEWRTSPPLSRALLEKHRATATLSPQALELLMAHSFPGNIRELENAPKRAVALSRGASTLEAHHFAHLTDLGVGGRGLAWGAAGNGGGNVECGGRRRGTWSAAGASDGRLGFTFPDGVRALADALWEEPARGGFSDDDGGSASRGSRYEQRARHRAALLELTTRRALEAWPRALLLQWGRLFGAKWASTENGLNVRELARELRLDSRSADSARRVMRMVAGVAVGRVGRG